MAKLFAFREDRLGFSYEINEKAVLGRAPECDLLIFDRSASRNHCEIFMIDDKYFIADMGSTNGTIVNDHSISIQTRLEPYDSIKIGQELFIFEPGLQVVVGPAPSALIIESLAEEVNNLVTSPAEQAAAAVDPADVPDLMSLAYQLEQAADNNALNEVLYRYLKKRFNLTFAAILWPSLSPAKRLLSLYSSHEDKCLLLSHRPFIRAVRDREVLLWPKSISELSFVNGQRKVQFDDHPCLIGPLITAGGAEAGMMYFENQNEAFNEKDMRAFAAMLGIITPTISRMATAGYVLKEMKADPSPASEFLLSTSDDKIKILLSTAAQAAEGKKSIFLSGEAGSGKMALAEYIHNMSDRKNARLITVNLSTIPQVDIEATLFGRLGIGSELGQTGLVEMADGGTLFLRHVENLPPAAQKLLLMAIEEGIFFNLGAARPKAVDLRVISATSIDLWARVEAGYFREDLYSRLSATTISLPPLREVKHDFASVLNSFMSKAAKDLGLTFSGLDPAALECLRGYSWPGNFAELRMEAALRVLFSRNGRIAFEDLPVHLRMAPDTYMGDEGEQPPPLIMEAERYQLISAMSRCSGELEEVSKLLNQRPEHVIIKMRALGIDPMDYQNPEPLNSPLSPGMTSLPDN